MPSIGVFWVISGSIQCYYKNYNFKALQYEASGCFGEFSYFNSISPLTYEASQDCVVLCADLAVLHELFEKYIFDKQTFEQRSKEDFENMSKFKRLLKMSYKSSRCSLIIVDLIDKDGNLIVPVDYKTITIPTKAKLAEIKNTNLTPKLSPMLKWGGSSPNRVSPTHRVSKLHFELPLFSDTPREAAGHGKVEQIHPKSVFEILNEPIDKELELARIQQKKRKKLDSFLKMMPSLVKVRDVTRHHEVLATDEDIFTEASPVERDFRGIGHVKNKPSFVNETYLKEEPEDQSFEAEEAKVKLQVILPLFRMKKY